tara:strand:+ start:709 stop:867 length:159 start_codon:yes stop_codon:yes gene_type:complete
MYLSKPEVKIILLFSVTKALGVSSSINVKFILFSFLLDNVMISDRKLSISKS